MTKVMHNSPKVTRGHDTIIKGEKWRKLIIVLSFWVIILFLGLPAWWKTTKIHRAKLPLHDMREWSTSPQKHRIRFPLRIAVLASHLSLDQRNQVISTAQRILDVADHTTYHVYTLHAIPDDDFTLHAIYEAWNSPMGFFNGSSLTTTKLDFALAVRISHTDSASLQVTMNSANGLLTVHKPQNVSLPALASFLADQVAQTLHEEAITLSTIFSSDASPFKPMRTPHTADISTSFTHNLIRQRQNREFKYSPNYHLTFSLFTPSTRPSDWQIERAIEQYIQPLLGRLSVLSKFRVDTQVQLHAQFSTSFPAPKFNLTRSAWTFKREDLSGFINEAEWPLNPGIGTGPTINFLLYVPPIHRQPLLIVDSNSSVWLVPRWGSVMIHNYSPKTGQAIQDSSELDAASLEPAMITFSQSLLMLLGVPETPKYLPLQIASLARIHTSSLLVSASSTLGALVQLVESMPFIEIPRCVANYTTMAIYHLNQARYALEDAQFYAAFDHARQADLWAEKAYFEHTMVSQLYFPDEHKIAIYLPLLGPIAVPLLITLIKQVKAALTW